MKIIFILGKYRPNKCGISDYVKLLSEKLGFNSEIMQYCPSTGLSKAFNSFGEADFFSIQFAPYSFSTSGFSNQGLVILAKSLRNKKLHINFHEIWIGAYPNASWKERIIGWFQKREILNFINTSKPSVITCSNSAAMDRMKQAGINVKYLYLFGNIPYFQNGKNSCSNELQVAFFGTSYAKFPYELLAWKLKDISNKFNKSVQLKVIGRQREGDGLEQIKKISRTNGFTVFQMGECSEIEISKEFQNCDLGISTTPYDVLGKSGATAAMLEHGLPVLAYDDADTPKKELFIMEQFKDQVFLLNDINLTGRLDLFMQKPRKNFFDGVAYTLNNMLELTT